MHEPKDWQQSLHTPQMFADLITSGLAVEVTAAAKAFHPGYTPVAVESDVYERYVSWDSQAMREHGVCLDEGERLHTLVKAGVHAACQGGGCFACKTRDCRDSEARASKTILSITNYGRHGAPMWLIHR